MVRCLPEGEPMLSACIALLSQCVGCRCDALAQSALLCFAFSHTYLEAGIGGCKDCQEDQCCLESFVH